MSDAPTPPVPDVCLGHWRSEDDTRAMVIRQGEHGTEVSVWRRADRRLLMRRRPARWHPPKPGQEAGSIARERIGYLQAEVGTPNLGTTYDLMVARANTDAATHGGYAWIALAPDTPRADVRLFPEGGASYYEAVLGYWDDFVETLRDADAWMDPLSTWLPVAADDLPERPDDA